MPIRLQYTTQSECCATDDDIISSLTHHYAAIGMAQDFDAPTFTRFSDSLGNVVYPTLPMESIALAKLRVGQTLRWEVEVDSHYLPNDYKVKWSANGLSKNECVYGTAFQLTLEPRHVNIQFGIFVKLISNKEWHRYGDYDSLLTVTYTVLPAV